MKTTIAVVLFVATALAGAQAALPPALPASFTALWGQTFNVNGGGPGPGFVTTNMYVDGPNRRLRAVNNQLNTPGTNASFEWIQIDIGAGNVQGAGGGEVGQNDCCETKVPAGWQWASTMWFPSGPYTGPKPVNTPPTVDCFEGVGDFVGAGKSPTVFCFASDWAAGNNLPVFWFSGSDITAGIEAGTGPNANAIMGFQQGEPYPTFFTTAPACSTPCRDDVAASMLAAAAALGH